LIEKIKALEEDDMILEHLNSVFEVNQRAARMQAWLHVDELKFYPGDEVHFTHCKKLVYGTVTKVNTVNVKVREYIELDNGNLKEKTWLVSKQKLFKDWGVL
jgi:hypothetical protein